MNEFCFLFFLTKRDHLQDLRDTVNLVKDRTVK